MDVKRIRSTAVQMFAALEDGKIPFINYLYLFAGIMLLRVFLNAFSQDINQFDLPTMLMKESSIHMLVAYAGLLMLLALFVHYTTKQPVEKVLRVFIPLMLVLLLAPLWDLFFYSDDGIALLYMQPGDHIKIFSAYLTFFGGVDGISTGVRVETALFLLLGLIYFREKNYHFVHCMLLTAGLYSIIFVWAATPYLVRLILNLFGYIYHYTNEGMIRFFLVADFVLLAWVSMQFNPKLFSIVSDNLRVDNLFYYLLTLVFGASIAFSLQYSSFTSYMRMYPPVAINELLAMISVFFAYLFATCINPRHAGNGKELDVLAKAFLWLSLIYAAMISAHAFVIISALLASFFIYNMLPIQLKRFVMISKLPIGFQSFAALFLGFVLVQHGTYEFPEALAWIYLVGMTLAANVLDLDPMLTTNNTLPALIGEKYAKVVLGCVLFIVTLAFYAVFDNVRLLPILVLIGVGFFYLINKRDYDEWQLKLLGNISLAVASVYLLSSWA